MSLSLYHSATGKQAPHCIHAIGIGKAGTYMVDALLRTGEIEDLLEDKRARFTALSVDIGDQDQHQFRNYGQGFLERLEDRDIPTERAQIRTVSLEVPSREDLFAKLRRYREYLKIEYPRYYWNPNYEPWLPEDVEIPEAGTGRVIEGTTVASTHHFPRAISKAIYNTEYYEDGPVAQALDEFAKSVNDTKKLPSMVLICFGLGGGTGSGIVVDLARHIANVKLGRRIPVIGVGVLPHSGDAEHHRDGSLFATLNEIDCMLDEEKNQGVQAVWGDLYNNPFTGGFFVLPQEHSLQRVQRYAKGSEGMSDPGIREGQANRTAGKYVCDTFMRYVSKDYGRELFKVLRPMGVTGAPHESDHAKDRYWTMFDVVKLMHPGVQVLPGEPMSKWREVISEWIEYIPQWSGLREGFKTDYIEAHTFAPRSRWNDTVQRKLEDTLSEFLLPGDDGTLNTTVGEAFDELTVLTDVIIPGVARTDLKVFWEAREKYDQMSWDEKLLAHSWLLDLGTMLSEPSTRFEGMAGECIWGCACWVVVPFEQIRGDGPVSAHRLEATQDFIQEAVESVVEIPDLSTR
jgi:hypothetical protein